MLFISQESVCPWCPWPTGAQMASRSMSPTSFYFWRSSALQSWTINYSPRPVITIDFGGAIAIIPFYKHIQDHQSCMHGMLLIRNHRTATFNFWSKRLLATVLVWLGNTRAVDLCIESRIKQRQCNCLPWLCNTSPYVHVTCVQYPCVLSVTLLFPNLMTFLICCICIHGTLQSHGHSMPHWPNWSSTVTDTVSAKHMLHM